LKPVGYLRPVAEQAVDPDVRCPDERDLDRQPGFAREQRASGDRERERIRVREVVEGRADAGPAEIAGERHVRCEEEDEEGPDRIVAVEVERPSRSL
jgi:hypothetical protein